MVSLRYRFSLMSVVAACIALFKTCCAASVTFAKYGLAKISRLFDVQLPRISDNLVLVGEPNSEGFRPVTFERTYRNRAAARNV